MNRYSFWALAIAVIACGSAVCAYSAPSSGYNGHAAEGASGDYQLQSVGGSGSGSGSNADGSAVAAAGGQQGADASGPAAPSTFGSNNNVPYAQGNTKGNTVTSSITYPQNKGEILIHRPAAIIVKRPPTKVLVNHPPLVVKPAPVVLHKPPAIVMRKVYVKHHPRPVKVEPVYVNVVKPPAEKYFVNEKQQQFAGQQFTPINFASGLSGVPALAAADSDNAAANGYQLLQGNQGFGALAGIHGSIPSDYQPASPPAGPYAYQPAPAPYPQSSYEPSYSNSQPQPAYASQSAY